MPGDLASDPLPVRATRRQIADRPAGSPRGFLRRLSQSSGQSFRKACEILQQYPGSPEVGHHPGAVGKDPQRSPEHQAVEA
jgi:hypothetical protein